MLGQSTYDIGDGEATGEVYCIAHHLTPGAAARRHRLRDVHPLRGHLPARHRGRLEVRAPAPARRLDRDPGREPGGHGRETTWTEPWRASAPSSSAAVRASAWARRGVLARDGALVTIAGRTEQKLVDAAAALADEGLERLPRRVRRARQQRRCAPRSTRPPTTNAGCRSRSSCPGLGAHHAGAPLRRRRLQHAQIDANVRPIYLFLKYAGQAMVRAGGGSFVAISSTAAVFSTQVPRVATPPGRRRWTSSCGSPPTSWVSSACG